MALAALLSAQIEGLLPKHKVFNTNKTTSTHLHKRTALYMLRSLGQFLIPSFLQHGDREGGNNEKQSTQREPSRPTEFLDGVRGLAAILVLIFHFCVRPYPGVGYGYGFEDNDSLWQLPFVRFIYSGHTMVAIFFIISGYVLSVKGIQLIRSQSHNQLLLTLSSTTFRRAVRLFLPSFAASFGCYLIQRAGFLGRPYPGYVSTFSTDTTHYLIFLRHLYNVWTWNPYHGFYNLQLWTIPVEFRCSMVVFLTLLGLSRCRMGARLLIETAGALNCLANDRWDMAPFFVGMIYAELDIERQDRAKQYNLPKITTATISIDFSFRRYLVYAIFAFGIYLGCVPENSPDETPGYIWLSSLDWHKSQEKFRYLGTYGAMLIVGSILVLPSLQRIFTTPFARYSGKISYALYLNHGILNRSFGVRFQRRVWNFIGKESWVQYNFSVLICAFAYVSLSVWVADVFWRAVDIPSIKLARWLEQKSLAPLPQENPDLR